MRFRAKSPTTEGLDEARETVRLATEAEYASWPALDSVPVCPKCGHGDLGTRYHPAHDNWEFWIWDCGGDLSHPRYVEHHRRWCLRCGHYWVEKAL